MLILLEGRIQRKHHVKRLHQRIVDAGVNWNVQNVAGHPAVVSQGKVDILTGGRNIVQKLFHLWWPDLHKRIYVRHCFGVANRRRLLIFVDICHSIDPFQYFFGVLVCIFNGVDFGILALVSLVLVYQLQIDLGLVRLVERRFILNWIFSYQHEKTHGLGLSIRSGHLQKGINLSNGRNVLRNKSFELGIEIGQHRSVSKSNETYLWIVLKSYFNSPLTGKLAYWAGS